jgi:hypothetical protein
VKKFESLVREQIFKILTRIINRNNLKEEYDILKSKEHDDVICDRKNKKEMNKKK